MVRHGVQRCVTALRRSGLVTDRSLACGFVRFRSVAVATLLLVLLTPGLAGSQDPFSGLALIKPSRAQTAKPFRIPTPNGKSIKLADYRGKVVFLNFWATWCPPCKEEMPAVERLYQRYKDLGLVVLAVSVDAEGAEAVSPFMKEYKFTFPVGLDPKMSLAAEYAVRGLPSSFFVDKDGNLAAMVIGPREWDSKTAHALVELLLKRG